MTAAMSDLLKLNMSLLLLVITVLDSFLLSSDADTKNMSEFFGALNLEPSRGSMAQARLKSYSTS
jgi:hypothetical protein